MNNRLKILILLFASLYSQNSYSQNSIKANIIDAKSQLSLINAHIQNIQNGKATISNNQGFFKIQANPNDTIQISYLGYQSKKMLAYEIDQKRIIELDEQVSLMESIVVIAEDPYLYNLISIIRKKIKSQKKKSTSKAYLNIVSHCNEKPVEFLEAYYNATIKQASLHNLEFKNGKSFLSKNEFGTYYLNIDMSKALTMYSVLHKQSPFPTNPFQLSKRKLKKEIALTLENKTDKEIKISFKPRKGRSGFFSGTVWINYITEEIIALELNSDETSSKVFRGIGKSVLDTINYTLFYSFQKANNTNQLRFLKLKYNAILTSDSIRTLHTNAESMIHLFDYNESFIAPQFKAPSLITDYKRFTIPPKEGIVWSALTQMNQVKLTARKDSLKKVIHNTGREFTDEILEEESFFEHNYIQWSSDKRLRLKKRPKALNNGSRRNLTNGPTATVVNSDLLNLEVQLYLDIIKQGDTLLFDTNTLFDIYKSYNYLEETSNVNTYTNLYFDIAEVYRRKLVAKLKDENLSTSEALDVYLQISRELNIELARFTKDCFAGRNTIKLNRWNDYILSEIGIDNLRYIDNTPKFPNSDW